MGYIVSWYTKSGGQNYGGLVWCVKAQRELKNENEKKRHLIPKTFEIRDFIFRIEKFTQLK